MLDQIVSQMDISLPTDVLVIIMLLCEESWPLICTVSRRFARSIAQASKLCLYKPRLVRSKRYYVDMIMQKDAILAHVLQKYTYNVPRFGDIIRMGEGTARVTYIYDGKEIIEINRGECWYYLPWEFTILHTDRGWYPPHYYDGICPYVCYTGKVLCNNKALIEPWRYTIQYDDISVYFISNGNTIRLFPNGNSWDTLRMYLGKQLADLLSSAYCIEVEKDYVDNDTTHNFIVLDLFDDSGKSIKR
jgi:hypothetical protein